MTKKYRSEQLRIVIQSYRELGKNTAHRSEIISKWREIRVREGLEQVNDNWVDYVLHQYPEFFRCTRKGSGVWEYLE